jgi:hypothetical protein
MIDCLDHRSMRKLNCVLLHFVRVCMHTSTYTRIHTYAHIYAHMQRYVHLCTHMHTCARRDPQEGLGTKRFRDAEIDRTTWGRGASRRTDPQDDLGAKRFRDAEIDRRVYGRKDLGTQRSTARTGDEKL